MITFIIRLHSINCANEIRHKIHNTFGKENVDITFSNSSAAASMHGPSCLEYNKKVRGNMFGGSDPAGIDI